MFSFCLILYLVGQLPGSLSYDPGLSWYTLETPNFAVHFSSQGKLDPEAESLARRVAVVAEEVHDRLTSSIGWTPKPRTQIVIADFFDYENGWAAPLPENTITILPCPPFGQRTNYDDWLRTLLLHEYTHIIQMDMAKGLPAAVRFFFGRIGLTNPLSPIWLLEGYALHTETRFAGFGRARSAEHDMMIRAAADAGTLLPIDRCCNYELERWPLGNSPYLYGGLFCRYLARRFGSDIWDRYSLTRSGGLPFFDNDFARRVFDQDFRRLWAEWQKEVTTYSDSVARLVRSETLARPHPLTEEGAFTSSPVWSRTGTEVYYISRNNTEYPAIKALDVHTGDCRVLHRGRVTGNLTVSADGSLLAFAQYELTDHSDLCDLYTLHLHTGEFKRLTRGMRARDPDFSPDSVSLAFVSARNGRSDLMLYHLVTGELRNLTETTDYTVFSSPRFSPDGRYLAAAAARAGGYADIQILDLESGWNTFVSEDVALDLSPCWSRDGRNLFFSSDRSGIFNLYAYSSKTGDILRCTSVPYGAFQPAVCPDNRKIAFVIHSAQGDDIAAIPLAAGEWKPASAFTDTGRSLPARGPDSPIVTSHSLPSGTTSALYYYNPFPSLLPKLWLPFTWRDSAWAFGAFTLGWDALQFHRYAAAAGYRLDTGPFLLAGYQLRRYRPLAGLTLAGDRHIQSGALSFALPFLTNRRSSQLDFLAHTRHDTLLSTRYSLGFATSNAFAYRFDVAPVEGAVAGIAADLESRHTLGQRDRTRVLAYCSGFLGYPPGSRSALGYQRSSFLTNWSLRLRCAAGTAFGDSSQHNAWRTFPDASILGVRGFPSASDSGRHTVSAGVQVRLPLFRPERGISTAPLFLRNVNAALFADWAMVWNQWKPLRNDLADSRLGAGAELRADLILAHLLPASLTVGYARAIRPESSNQLYVGVTSSMLGNLLVRPSDRLDPAFLRY